MAEKRNAMHDISRGNRADDLIEAILDGVTAGIVITKVTDCSSPALFNSALIGDGTKVKID